MKYYLFLRASWCSSEMLSAARKCSEFTPAKETSNRKAEIQTLARKFTWNTCPASISVFWLTLSVNSLEKFWIERTSDWSREINKPSSIAHIHAARFRTFSLFWIISTVFHDNYLKLIWSFGSKNIINQFDESSDRCQFKNSYSVETHIDINRD